MRLDFHVHGLLTKKINFDEELFLQGLEYAKEQGLNGIVLCEHFNANEIYVIYNYLRENYEYVGDKYDVNGMSVFVGMEVDIKNGGHIIVCGNRDNILEIRKELEVYSVKPNFIAFEELLDLGDKYNCLMVGSHPYREDHKLYLQDKELIKRLDALDLNATDIYNFGVDDAINKVQALSQEVNVPYVTGSDSHFPIQLGTVKTNFKEEFTKVMEIKEAIKSRNYEIEISKALNLKVYSAKTTKKIIKESAKFDGSVWCHKAN